MSLLFHVVSMFKTYQKNVQYMPKNMEKNNAKCFVHPRSTAASPWESQGPDLQKLWCGQRNWASQLVFFVDFLLKSYEKPNSAEKTHP